MRKPLAEGDGLRLVDQLFGHFNASRFYATGSFLMMRQPPAWQDAALRGLSPDVQHSCNEDSDIVAARPRSRSERRRLPADSSARRERATCACRVHTTSKINALRHS